MEQAPFDSAFLCKYSEHTHIIASRKHPDDIPETITTERIVRLNELQREFSSKRTMPISANSGKS